MSKPPQSLALSFSTAGIGGIMGWIIVHPFSTVAVRMNLLQASGDVAAKKMSFVQYTKHIIKTQGVSTLYNGLSAGIIRQIFYATSRFGLFEVMRDQLAKYRETDLFSRLLVGVVSGGVAAYISCPAEVSLVRMSNDKSLPVDQRRNYTSVFNAATRIIKEEGVSTFWRGSVPFVNRSMLVGATQVGTYDQFRATFRKLGITDTPNAICASMCSGLLYSLITMPFETAKNRMAFQKPDPVTGQLLYKSTFQTISYVAKTNGTLSLWAGFLPYYGRCGGHTVCMFVAVEWLRKLANQRGYY